MSDQAERTSEDLMVEEGIWPRTGGWWQCVDHGFFSSTDLVEWTHSESGVPGWQCPKCGRRDLIQWEQALIAVPAAHHDHALQQQRKQVIAEVEEVLTKVERFDIVDDPEDRSVRVWPESHPEGSYVRVDDLRAALTKE